MAARFSPAAVPRAAPVFPTKEEIPWAGQDPAPGRRGETLLMKTRLQGRREFCEIPPSLPQFVPDFFEGEP